MPPRLSDSSGWMFGAAIATIVWSMNVIATANIIAASARFFDPRRRLDGCGLGHAATPRCRRPVRPAGLLPPAVFRTIRRAREEKGRLGKSDRPRTYGRRHGDGRVVVIERVVPNRLWHALEDDRVVGRAHLRRRPDDRAFVAADAWQEPVTRALLDAVAADVPGDLHTIAGEEEADELALLTAAGYAECAGRTSTSCRSGRR